MYEYCNTTSKKLNKKIVFEISLGKEDGGFDKYEEIKQIVSKMESFCRNGDFPLPYFLVVRTGNYVMELKNVGSFESTFLDTNQDSSKINLLKTIEFCNKHQIRIKEHNTDYLSDRALQLHPEMVYMLQTLHRSLLLRKLGHFVTIKKIPIRKKN